MVEFTIPETPDIDMPEQRELTEDELLNLEKQGINSDNYRGKKVNVLSDDEVAQQAPPTQQPSSGKIGKLETVLKTEKAHLGSQLGGGAGALGTGALIAALVGAPETMGASLLALPFIAGGALGGSYLGGKGQQAILGEEKQKQLEQEAQEASTQHPLVAGATDIAASALASGGSFKPSNIPRAGRALLSSLAGKGVEDVDKYALQQVLMNAAINPAVNTGVGLAAGQGLPSSKELLSQVAGGALFSGSSKLGNLVHGIGRTPEPAPEPTVKVVSSESAQPIVRLPAQLPQPAPPIAPPTGETQVPRVALPDEALRIPLISKAPEFTPPPQPPVVKLPRELPKREQIISPSNPEEPIPLVRLPAKLPPKATPIPPSVEQIPYVKLPTTLPPKVAPVAPPMEEQAKPKVPLLEGPEHDDIRALAQRMSVEQEEGPRSKAKPPIPVEEAPKETGVPVGTETPLATKTKEGWIAKATGKPIEDPALVAQIEKMAVNSKDKAPDSGLNISTIALNKPLDFLENHPTQVQSSVKAYFHELANDPDSADTSSWRNQALEDVREHVEEGLRPRLISEINDHADFLKGVRKEYVKGGRLLNANGDIASSTKIELELLKKNKQWGPLASSLKMDEQSLKVPITYSMTENRSHYKNLSDYIRMEHPDIDQPEVILHEIIHGATSAKIPIEWRGLRGYKLKGAMDEYLKSGTSEPLKEVIRSYYQAAKELGLSGSLFGERVSGNIIEKGIAGVPDITQKKIPLHGYQMGNLHEFLSGVMTREKFQKHLNEIPSGLNDGKSLWSRLVDGIRKLLGIDVKQGSLLNRALTASDALMQQSRNTKSKMVNADLTKLESNKDFAPKPEKEIPPTRVGGFLGGIFRSTVDRVRDINHPLAKEVGDAFNNTLEDRQRYVGEQLSPTLKKAQSYDITGNSTANKHLEAAMRYELETGKDGTHLLATKQEREVFNEAKEGLKRGFAERFKNEEPVYTNGVPSAPSKGAFHWTTTADPKVAEMYRVGADSDKIAKYDSIFKDYQEKLGFSSEEAERNLKLWKTAVQGEKNPNTTTGQSFYSQRQAERIPLPPEFTREGFLKNLEAGVHRQAMSSAYYKNVESKPNVLSALGEKMDAYGKPVPESPNMLGQNPAVKAALEEIKGDVGTSGSYNEKALSSLATTMFIGPGTTVHKILSNFVGITNYVDNPYQLGKLLTSMVTNASKGLEHAEKGGLIRYSAQSANDLTWGNILSAEGLRTLAHTVRGVYSLGDLTDKYGAALLQAGAEGILPAKVTKANNGDTTNQQLLRRLDPDYKVGKTYDDAGIAKLATNIVGSIHGTGDARTLPPWMIHDSELSGFFKLSHWGISQTNRFMSDIYIPATRGNLTPLLTSLFGSAVGGYLIKELREKLQGKKGQIPSLAELQSSSKGLEGNVPLVAYNLMASLSYAGFAGMFSQFGKIPFDQMKNNTSQGMVFPLDEVVTDLGHVMGQVTSAIANDPNLNWLSLASEVGKHFMSTNFQLGRVAINQMIDNGIMDGLPAEKKQLADKLAQLRRFNLTEGMPVEEIDTVGNPFSNIEQKRFKLEQDPTEIVKQLPELISGIMDKYGDKPDLMMSKIQALKQNSYATFPSLEKMPLSFMKYVDYLTKLEGPDKAQAAIMDWASHEAVNKAKASVVP